MKKIFAIHIKKKRRINQKYQRTSYIICGTSYSLIKKRSDKPFVSNNLNKYFIFFKKAIKWKVIIWKDAYLVIKKILMKSIMWDCYMWKLLKWKVYCLIISTMWKTRSMFPNSAPPQNLNFVCYFRFTVLGFLPQSDNVTSSLSWYIYLAV